MKWFMPHASSEETAREAYESIKRHVSDVLGVSRFSDRRIRRIAFSHNTKPVIAEVGQTMHLREIREEVFAILYEPERDLYHVCTPSRGVLRGMSVLVGANEVSSTEDFDSK